MAIAKKPQSQTNLETSEVDALIQKGGSVAGENSLTSETDNAASGKEKSVILRLSAETLQQIDRAVQLRRIKIPRHTWFLEAVMEKLDREFAKE